MRGKTYHLRSLTDACQKETNGTVSELNDHRLPPCVMRDDNTMDRATPVPIAWQRLLSIGRHVTVEKSLSLDYALQLLRDLTQTVRLYCYIPLFPFSSISFQSVIAYYYNFRIGVAT